MNFNNIAYRDWLGGKDNFDVYGLDLRGFWEHGDGHVFAARQSNQWTFMRRLAPRPLSFSVDTRWVNS